MTQKQTIEQITAKLATLDDEQLQAVAEIVQSMHDDGLQDSVLPRELTDEELALIEQSWEDFRQGRTLKLDAAEARTDALLAERRRTSAAE